MKKCCSYDKARMSFAVLIDHLMDKVSNFSVFDFAILKLTLVSFGVLIGTFWHKTFRKLAPVVLVIGICSYIYMIYRLFIED